MSIPDYQSLMLPLFKLASDKKEHYYRDAVKQIADEFGLTEEEKSELLPSGTQPTIYNRVGWAKFYLEKAGLFEKTKRAYFKITNRGLNILKKNPTAINNKFLEQFDEFTEFVQLNNKKKEEAPNYEETPEEALEVAHQTLKQALSSEIIKEIKQRTPEFLERLVVDLLVKMGYGGSRFEAGQAIGKSGDGGIDGIIKEDRLGLDIIYIQAKRWESIVGRPEIQKFAGALQGHRARKGIFITTSSYTKDALDYVKNIDTKIILIDGIILTDLMIEHNIGVTPVSIYEVKRIDSDYYED